VTTINEENDDNRTAEGTVEDPAGQRNKYQGGGATAPAQGGVRLANEQPPAGPNDKMQGGIAAANQERAAQAGVHSATTGAPPRTDERAVPRIGAAAPFGPKPPGGVTPTITIPAITRQMSPNELVGAPPGSFEASPEKEAAEEEENAATGKPKTDEDE
jgi:hypothetical protein